MMTAEQITALLQTDTLGRTLKVYDSLPSTNDTAKACTATLPHGAVIIADTQVCGRGRRGRTFFSPQGNGIYMSVALHTPFTAEDVGLLTSLTAVAVAEAIELLCDVAVQIKWVNDLLIGGKKVCGILTEGQYDSERGHYTNTVIGIGINVSGNTFPPPLDSIATSLQTACGTYLHRAPLIAAILQRLEWHLTHMESGTFLQQNRRRSAVLGKTVTVITAADEYPAMAVDIDNKGQLVVKTDTETITLSSGEVSLKL